MFLSNIAATIANGMKSMHENVQGALNAAGRVEGLYLADVCVSGV
jgi:hypothetical protein